MLSHQALVYAGSNILHGLDMRCAYEVFITVCLENETAAEPCLREPPQAVIMREIARYRSASEEARKPYTKGAEWH